MSKSLGCLLCVLCFILVFTVETNVEAGEVQQSIETPHITRANLQNKEGRKKFIDFDGDLVEGMNKSPYDSLNQVTEAQKKRRVVHLYRKRKGFAMEIQQTLKKMRYVP